jgi:hypothetical protein
LEKYLKLEPKAADAEKIREHDQKTTTQGLTNPASGRKQSRLTKELATTRTRGEFFPAFCLAEPSVSGGFKFEVQL